MATTKDPVETLAAMSPARRAIQLAADTVTNFANKATFGGVGAVGDLVRGAPLGTTGQQISDQLTAASPFAQAASSGLGFVAPVGGIVRGGKIAAQGVGRLLVDGVGERAAALGAKAAVRPAVKTAFKAAAVPAGVLGTAAYLTGDPGTPAVAAAPAARPAKGAPTNAVDAALASGSKSTPAAADAINSYITNLINGGHASLKQIATAGELAPAMAASAAAEAAKTKPGTAKDAVLSNTAALSDNIYQSQLNDISQQLKSGSIDQDAAHAAANKATAEYFQRNAGLVGFDPSKLVNAQLLGAGQEQ